MAEASEGSQRIHYLDNLRALAMLLGVYLHGALAYAQPSRSVWIATNPEGSVLIDASIWWIHLFRMSLFFILSGYFAKRMIQRQGIRLFLWNRGLRIGLPFVIFCPLLMVAMTIVFVFALSYLKHPSGVMKLIATAEPNPAAHSSTRLSTMHLWFLYYLLMFSLIAAVASRWATWNFDWLFRRKAWLLLWPLALIPGAWGGGIPIIAPESFLPTWWPFLYYGWFYWAGWQLYGREALLDRLQPWRWGLLLLSVVLFVPHYAWMPVLDIELLLQDRETRSLASQLLESTVACYLSVSLTLCAWLFGHRYLARSSPGLKFCADSSYWVYLIHLPILLFLQTLLIPVAIPIWAKLVLVIVSAWLFCLATYVVFVRYTPIGWMLHGKRSFP